MQKSHALDLKKNACGGKKTLLDNKDMIITMSKSFHNVLT